VCSNEDFKTSDKLHVILSPCWGLMVPDPNFSVLLTSLKKLNILYYVLSTLIVSLNRHTFSLVLWYNKQSVNKFSLVQVAQYTYVSNFQASFCLYELISLENLSLFSAVFSPVVGSGILSCAQVKPFCADCADAGAAVVCRLSFFS
jgi:hypothetical protein